MRSTTRSLPDVSRGSIVAIATIAALLAALAAWQPLSAALFAAMVLIAFALLATDMYPEISICMLVGAAALDTTGRLATIGPLKITVYQGLAALFVLFVAARIRSGRSKLVRTPIDLPLAIYLLLAVASLFVAVDKSTALVQLVSFGSSVLLAYGVVIIADTPARLKNLIAATLVIAGVIAVFGVLEQMQIFTFSGYLVFQNAVRSKATFKDPNIMGSFETTAVALALPLAMTAVRRSSRLLWSIGILVAGVGLATTGSRGAMGGLIFAILVALVLSRVKFTTKIVIAAGIATLLAASVFTITNPSWLETRLLDVSSDNSTLYRVYMGASALEMAVDNPGGIGVGNYPVLYPFYRNGLSKPDLVESHTAYLTILVEVGVLGLIFFLATLTSFTLAVFKAISDRTLDVELQAMGVGALAAVVALAAQAFTYSLEASKFWWMSIGIGLAVWAMARKRTPASPCETPVENAS